VLSMDLLFIDHPLSLLAVYSNVPLVLSMDCITSEAYKGKKLSSTSSPQLSIAYHSTTMQIPKKNEPTSDFSAEMGTRPASPAIQSVIAGLQGLQLDPSKWRSPLSPFAC
jgi:hypothetical protein